MTLNRNRHGRKMMTNTRKSRTRIWARLPGAVACAALVTSSIAQAGVPTELNVNPTADFVTAPNSQASAWVGWKSTGAAQYWVSYKTANQSNFTTILVNRAPAPASTTTTLLTGLDTGQDLTVKVSEKLPVSFSSTVTVRLPQAYPSGTEHDNYIAADNYSKAHKGDYILVMKNGGIVYQSPTPGTTDPNNKEFTNANFIHTLNSGTKSFSCVLQAFAVRDKPFDMALDRKLTNKITDWATHVDPQYPDVSNNADVTLRDLLMLRSGLAGNEDYDVNSVSTADTYGYSVNEISPTDRPNAEFIYDPLSFQNFALYFQIAMGRTYAGNGKLHTNSQDSHNPVEYLHDKLFQKFELGLVPDSVIDGADNDGSGYPDAYESDSTYQNSPNFYAWGQDGAIDADGNADYHDQMAGGAAFSARAWAKYGQFMLQQGSWNGERLLPASALDTCVNGALSGNTTPNPVFAGYGISFWLNAELGDTYQPLENGEGDSLPPAVGADLCDGRTRLWPHAPTTAFAAAGGLFQRLYVIPSENMVVVRFGAVPKEINEAPPLPLCPLHTPPDQFDDDDFLQALLGT